MNDELFNASGREVRESFSNSSRVKQEGQKLQSNYEEHKAYVEEENYPETREPSATIYNSMPDSMTTGTPVEEEVVE